MKTLVFQLQESFDNNDLPLLSERFTGIAEKGQEENYIAFRFSKISTDDILKISCGNNAHFTGPNGGTSLGKEITIGTSNDRYRLYIDTGTTTSFSIDKPEISNVVNSQLMLEENLSNLPNDMFINATIFYGMLNIVGGVTDLVTKMPKIEVAFLQYSQMTGTLESMADMLKDNRDNGSTLKVTGNNLVTYNGSTFDNVVKTITFDGAGGYTVS